MLSIGGSKVSKLYIGDTEYKKAYLGDTLVLDNSVKLYTVSASINPADAGAITGTGTYAEGTQVTLVANPADKYSFKGWVENGTTVSTNTSYTFTVNGDRTFTASFEKIPTYIAGIDWFETTLPSSNNWVCVAGGNGKFVALWSSTSSETKSAYSSDGIKWHSSTTSMAPVYWLDMIFGADKFLAVGDGTASDYSSNGIGWTAIGMRKDAYWRTVAYGNGRFVAICRNSKQAIYGKTSQTAWTLSTMASYANWVSITYGQDKFVVIAYNSSIGNYSFDGITWNTFSMPNSEPWRSITYGNDKFVAIAGGESQSNSCAYSNDGITWYSSTLPLSADWKNVTYGDGKFVAVGYTDKAAYSYDGIKWELASLPSSANWQDVAYSNGKFVVIANNSKKAAYSYTGD